MTNEKFEYLKIARCIPAGTRNIDLMRKDIHGTVKAVLGLLLEEENYLRNAHFSESIGGYQWHIYCREWVVVECIYTKSGADVIERPYDSTITGGQIKVEHVQRIYEMLGLFIESMYLLFPVLAGRMKPLIEAAGINRDLLN